MEAGNEEDDETTPASPLPIREAVLQEIIGLETEVRFQPQALQLTSVLIRCFVEEAWHRAAAEAAEAGDQEIQEEHLERVLPQLLLDFGP